MKKLTFLFLLVSVFLITVSCNKEESVDPNALYTVEYWQTELNHQGDCCRGSMDDMCYDCGPGRD